MRGRTRVARGACDVAVAAVLFAGSFAIARAQMAATVVDIVQSDGGLSTFCAALESTGVIETLKGAGPFTLFAPTNDGFATIPRGRRDAILNDKAKLTQLVLNHVLGSRTTAAELPKMGATRTLSGMSIFLRPSDGGVRVNSARTLKRDLGARNGVVHVIDGVLLPLDLVEAAAAAGSFSTMVQAIQEAGLVSSLRHVGPFTVFAPSDEAFLKLPSATRQRLISDTAKLSELLKGHIVSGSLTREKLSTMSRLYTLEPGRVLHIEVAEGKLTVDGGNVVRDEIVFGSGVIHVIDAVLVPKE